MKYLVTTSFEFPHSLAHASEFFFDVLNDQLCSNLDKICQAQVDLNSGEMNKDYFDHMVRILKENNETIKQLLENMKVVKDASK